MVNVPVVAELQRLDGLRLSHVGANALYGLHLQGHPPSTVVQPLSGDIWSACTYRMAQYGSTSVEWTQGSMYIARRQETMSPAHAARVGL
jgi:hypothetical protein